MRMPAGYRMYPLDTTGWTEFVPTEETAIMARFQVIWRLKGSSDEWLDMGTTFDTRAEAILAAAEYDERWSDREHTVVTLTPERVAELALEAAMDQAGEEANAEFDAMVAKYDTPDHGAKGGSASSPSAEVPAEAPAPSYGAESAGCWFDGCRGIYLGDAVIRLAIDHGWVCDVEPVGGFKWAPMGVSWSDHEHYHELTDEAEEFMGQFAAEGYYFGYQEHTGDFGLWKCDEEEG